MYEKKSRIHLSRLGNKYKNCNGIKYNPSFGQNRDYGRYLIWRINRKPRKRLPRKNREKSLKRLLVAFLHDIQMMVMISK